MPMPDPHEWISAVICLHINELGRMPVQISRGVAVSAAGAGIKV